MHFADSSLIIYLYCYNKVCVYVYACICVSVSRWFLPMDSGKLSAPPARGWEAIVLHTCTRFFFCNAFFSMVNGRILTKLNWTISWIGGSHLAMKKTPPFTMPLEDKKDVYTSGSAYHNSSSLSLSLCHRLPLKWHNEWIIILQMP